MDRRAAQKPQHQTDGGTKGMPVVTIDDLRRRPGLNDHVSQSFQRLGLSNFVNDSDESDLDFDGSTAHTIGSQSRQVKRDNCKPFKSGMQAADKVVQPLLWLCSTNT